MKPKTQKQKYTYFFKYRGEDKPRYVTTAYSVQQAVRQLEEKYPNNNIYSYFENHSFDIDRKPYVPKEEPKTKKQDGYSQLSFKGFMGENDPWRK